MGGWTCVEWWRRDGRRDFMSTNIIIFGITINEMRRNIMRPDGGVMKGVGHTEP